MTSGDQGMTAGCRVVSLVPSVTETLLAWGVEPVGVTRFCEQPQLQAVGGTKDPDVDLVISLAPDLVVVDVEENRRQDADALTAAGLEVHVLHVASVEDVEPALHHLALRLGVTPAHRGTAEVGDEVGEVGGPAVGLRAFVPIWRQRADPDGAVGYMTLNRATYGSSLLGALGVANVFADEVRTYPSTTLDAAAARRPDVVLAPSEPYPFGPRHVAELEQVAPVELVDGQDLFWWGARTPSALRRLRRQLVARTAPATSPGPDPGPRS